ncbi:hypothetical protein KKH42_03525, partial [bacterium]|nr:hypothetical protein [bacterium]
MKRQDLKALKALAVILLGALTVKITVWPLIADIKFKSGLKAMSLMEYEKAESDFKIAINYRKEPVYYENLAALYRTMGETAKDRNTGRRHYEQSVYFYKKLLELNPGNSLVYNGLGATCL